MKIETAEGRTIDTSKIVQIRAFTTFNRKGKKKFGVWCLMDDKSAISIAPFDTAIDAKNYKNYLEGLI